MDRVRLAIVGCGTISRLNAQGYLRDDRCEVVALCDPIRERAEARASEWRITPTIYTKYEDVLADRSVEAIEILTPTHLHADQIISGLDAGKHISCQKPIAASMTEADQIVKAAAHAKTLFRVTENFLFYPPIVKAKQLLDEGAIGEPNFLTIRTIIGNERLTANDFTIEAEATEWRRDATKNPGGKLYDDGVHKYATAMWWIGDFESVYGIVTKTDDFIIEAPSASMWRFKDKNCLGVIDYCFANEMPIRSKYYPMDEFFEITGSKGIIWVTRCTGEMLNLAPVMVHYGHETTNFHVPMDWIEGFNAAARNFIDCILAGEQPMMDADFAKKVLQAALSVYRSSETNMPLDVSKDG